MNTSDYRIIKHGDEHGYEEDNGPRLWSWKEGKRFRKSNKTHRCTYNGEKFKRTIDI